MTRPPKPSDTSTYAGRFGAALRARRERKRLSVAEAASKAGCAASTWYHWEKAERLPSLDDLPAIAAALKCKPAALLP
jgi:transcriptional regulator with XRE-family HTH domain